MTTHVLIVNSQTFAIHLNYMFAGTGSKDKDVDFNNNSSSNLYPNRKHAAEDSLVAMMADGSRLRKGDYIIFYVQANKDQEGKFYGIFKAVDDGIFIEQFNLGKQYLHNKLGKNLTFRFKIEPEEVYSKGVTEWQALDEIKNIRCPNQILWSLIYRKLRGNRGNTMITIYEAERLFGLIRQTNNNIPLKAKGYAFNPTSGEIVPGQTLPYSSSNSAPINLLPRLVKKYQCGLAHETHLQQYIVQNIGKNENINDCFGIQNKEIEWIGNEVACGVGMQRIDIMVSVKESEIKRILFPIELKAVEVTKDTVNQLDRYIDWIEQYYISNRPSTIQPVLICKSNGQTSVSSQVKASFINFNSKGQVNGTQRYLPLIFIEYTALSTPNPSIIFNKINY